MSDTWPDDQELQMTDYRALLAKYMRHVGDEEGSVFMPWKEDGFTPDEVAELEAINTEILASVQSKARRA